MSAPPSARAAKRPPETARRPGTAAAAFGLGVPLGVGLLYLIFRGPWQHPLAQRYVSHPVEWAEVVLFCCALGALTAKLWHHLRERRACRAAVLPEWDGHPVPVTEAPALLENLRKLPRRWRTTALVARAEGALGFVCDRQSSADLDDHLRALADNDAVALDTSYSLTRFITWAIPILGFLGTVLGITDAIAGVTPEVLEQSLSQVTDGLATAFDTTALALVLTMVVMFVSFVVERAESGVLDEVDRFADRQLAHRFERLGAEGGETVAAVRQTTQALLQGVEQLVARQAELWADTFRETERQRLEAAAQQQDQLTTSLRAAMEQALLAHRERAAAIEGEALDQSGALLDKLTALAVAVRESGREQQDSLAEVSQRVGAQVEALSRLQEGEQHLLRLQDQLDRNLAVLAGAGTLEQAVLNLNAAINLLTARSAAVPRAGKVA